MITTITKRAAPHRPNPEEPVIHDIMMAPVGEADAELARLRAQALAEIDALRTEIEHLAKVKEQTRTEMRCLLEDCLARLSADEAGPGAAVSEESPPRPESAAEPAGPGQPVSRLLQTLCNPAKRRPGLADALEQAPMLLVLALIILQQLAPTIQRLALLG